MRGRTHIASNYVKNDKHTTASIVLNLDTDTILFYVFDGSCATLIHFPSFRQQIRLTACV